MVGIDDSRLKVKGGVVRFESWLQVDLGVGGDRRSSLLGVRLGGKDLLTSMCNA